MVKRMFNYETGEYEDVDIPQELIDLSRIKPVLNNKGERLGKIMIFGTIGSDNNYMEELRNMFYNPENYD